ncbi:hypothetical protein DSO57_1001810 [Entomophthora muscae]|uniref:Uncharacterized protein n=1 Tax=Entomophthora muscae TaxID=34485 RepID=A0ACC2U7A5_9FUNG|nr:hypothetical protein DSO57_1001810 [Entomophthora muscae]
MGLVKAVKLAENSQKPQAPVIQCTLALQSINGVQKSLVIFGGPGTKIASGCVIAES